MSVIKTKITNPTNVKQFYKWAGLRGAFIDSKRTFEISGDLYQIIKNDPRLIAGMAHDIKHKRALLETEVQELPVEETSIVPVYEPSMELPEIESEEIFETVKDGFEELQGSDDDDRSVFNLFTGVVETEKREPVINFSDKEALVKALETPTHKTINLDKVSGEALTQAAEERITELALDSTTGDIAQDSEEAKDLALLRYKAKLRKMGVKALRVLAIKAGLDKELAEDCTKLELIEWLADDFQDRNDTLG
jgi:hypothetical protein